MSTMGARVADGLRAGAVAAVLSGLPSTVITLVRGGDLLASTEAAGSMVTGEGRSRNPRLLAGAAAHITISLGWALVLSGVLPRRWSRPATAVAGAAAGGAIAALDLGLIGRRFPRIRALDTVPQVLDHLAFGAVVGWIVSHPERHDHHRR